MGNFINDSGPNFKTGEVKLDSIPVYLYNKDFKKINRRLRELGYGSSFVPEFDDRT